MAELDFKDLAPGPAHNETNRSFLGPIILDAYSHALMKAGDKSDKGLNLPAGAAAAHGGGSANEKTLELPPLQAHMPVQQPRLDHSPVATPPVVPAKEELNFSGMASNSLKTTATVIAVKAFMDSPAKRVFIVGGLAVAGGSFLVDLGENQWKRHFSDK